MAHATTSDLYAEWGEAQARKLERRATAETDQQIDARVTAALSEADNYINSYIASAHNLPLAQIPPILKDVAVDIAYYKIHGVSGVSDRVRQVYEERIRWLRDIASGRASLGLNAAGDAEVSSAAQSGAVAEPNTAFPVEDINSRAV